MIFGADMKLSHVQYVPRLTCNLILFAQLLKELCCIVTLIDKLYVIQDRTSRMVIGVCEERDRVYCLCSTAPTAKSCHASEADSNQVWHQRFGHFSRQSVYRSARPYGFDYPIFRYSLLFHMTHVLVVNTQEAYQIYCSTGLFILRGNDCRL